MVLKWIGSAFKGVATGAGTTIGKGSIKAPFKTAGFGINHPILATAGLAGADHAITGGAGRSYLWEKFNTKGQELVENAVAKTIGDNPVADFLTNNWGKIGVVLASYMTLGKTAGLLAIASTVAIGLYDAYKDELPQEFTSVVDAWDPRQPSVAEPTQLRVNTQTPTAPAPTLTPVMGA